MPGPHFSAASWAWLSRFHGPIEPRHKRKLTRVFIRLLFFEREPPLPGRFVILDAVDLENRRPLFLIAFNLESGVEAPP